MPVTSIFVLVEFIVGVLEKLIPTVVTAIQSTSALSAAEKAALIARMSATLDARRAEVMAVVPLDPTDPANLPPT